jgi:RNA polymerase sigma factor (sigma-70 family)
VTESTPVEDLLRDLAPRVLGAVTRRVGDFDAAEDAVQEALLAAAQHWPVDGVPDNPHGWLVVTAVRRATDQVRSDAARRRREELAVALEPADPQPQADDDTLTLLFLCCHPALTPPSAVALTLRAVGGLTTAEIARAFLVPEATIAQRISRAKQRLKAAGVPFAHPTSDERGDRLRSVLRVLYLVFNEGYTSTAGDRLFRIELSSEAIRLARELHRLLPHDGEVAGLLALMLLTDARRAARLGEDGRLVPLTEQDRSRWDRALVVEGTSLVTEALSHGAVGEYQLQAAIAAVHDGARTAADTDWAQILALYTLLERMTGNPMVTLNREVAVAMVHGPERGLAELDGAAQRLGDHHRVDAVRAHLLELAGDADGAAAAYRAAAGRTSSLPEQRYLVEQAARVSRR